MSTTSLPLPNTGSDPVSIPIANQRNEEQTYKDMIKQLAAQAPEPYGAIPPLLKKKKKKKNKVPIRKMSHVENWIAVDSKESIPDEEDLVHSSPFRNFLSTDFLVLPLHMPPPSLSATTPDDEYDELIAKRNRKKKKHSRKKKEDLRPVLYPIKEPPVQVIPITKAKPEEEDEDEDEEDEEDEDEDEDEDDDEEDDEEDDDEEDEEDDDEDEDEDGSLSSSPSLAKRLLNIPHSFSQSTTPSTSTTKSYAMSSSHSPPKKQHLQQKPSLKKPRWLETIAQLKKSLTLSNATSSTSSTAATKYSSDELKASRRRLRNKKGFIPMPPPPHNLQKKKRRSEATTQPRFNPETNTYTRDTRSNPDHLRMISAELNMMRTRKLSSPLKPRGFLPRRTDAFIRGERRKSSGLKQEVLADED